MSKTKRFLNKKINNLTNNDLIQFIQKNLNKIKNKNFTLIPENASILIRKSKDQFHKKINFILDKDINFSLKPWVFLQILQDKLEKSLSGKTINQVVLKQSRFWAGAITWVLMGSTAFAIGWISIAKTEEVVIAIGKLEPEGGVLDVQMPLEGIAREILVKDGETVKKGQVLIRLDTQITKTRNQALEKSLELNENILEKLEYLSSEGAVSELDQIRQKAKVEDIKSEIQTNLVILGYQEIVSPIDGIVFELVPKSPGYVAQSSQPVLKIVPIKNLIAKVEIDSRTIGFVKPGKAAEISIDSFPASDFGVISGVVKNIGSDALPPQPALGKGYRFPAQVTLDNQYLKLKSGQKLPLQAGMSLTANIKLRKVTYLQLLLTNFSNKANSLKSI